MLRSSHDHYKMRRQQHHQQTLAKSIFNDNRSIGDERDALITQQMDEIARLKADIKHNSQMYDEKDAVYVKIDSSVCKITERCNMLFTRGKYDATAREQILLDLSRSTVEYADHKSRETKEIMKRLAAMAGEVEELKARMKDIERRDAANDSGSTPPSHGTITRQQIRARHQQENEQAATPAKMGPPKGHTGHHSAYDVDDRVDLSLDACPGCGRPLVRLDRYSKVALELEKIGVTEKLYDVYLYMCGTCGPISTEPDWMLNGTSIGKKWLIKIIRLSHTNKSMSELSETIEIAYGKRLCRDTLKKALETSQAPLRPEIDTIQANIAKSESGHLDDTVMPLGRDRNTYDCKTHGRAGGNGNDDNRGRAGKDGRMWVMVGDRNWVRYMAAQTRTKAEMMANFPYPDLPIHCDAYPAHNYFQVRQLCWAHVKTKVENGVIKNDAPTGQYLYHRLMNIYHHVKDLLPDTPIQYIQHLISETETIGRLLLQEGINAGTCVRNCAPYLFTAVTHTSMEFTNNLAERLLRRYVIRRKVIYRFATLRGAQRYCTIASCLETWKLQGRNAQTELERLFGI